MPVPPLTLQLAEGRVMCAMLAAGWTWDFDLVREPLNEAITALKSLASDHDTIHPMAAMAEPVLLQYDGDAGAAQSYFEQYQNSRDPWLRAAGKVFYASYAQTLGQLAGAERSCRDGLAEMRAMGEQWGIAMAQIQLAEFSEMRGDHAASIEAITEAATIGRELGVWGDITYVEARLAVVHARVGDLDRGYAELAQVQRSIEARGGQVDTDRWVMFMSAELALLKGDYAEAARCCETVLAAIAGNAAPWWGSLRAVVKARLAIAVLRQGDEPRCTALLTESVDTAAGWVEHPTLAVVLDACAIYAQTRAENRDLELSARLLGAAAALRGAFDESSLDAPRARESAIAALGEEAFTRAYTSVGSTTYESALALARSALTR
jgi:ATP/maltotriose-dependent transcriptional regulator MalT